VSIEDQWIVPLEEQRKGWFYGGQNETYVSKGLADKLEPESLSTPIENAPEMPLYRE
jgi:hypothetical protein